MFKKYKQLMLGIVIGAVLFSTPVFAATIIKNSYFNEDLNLVVNGTQSNVKFVTVEVEGEQWGRNYVSVADFIKALNDNAGFNGTVDFDSTSKTIIVDVDNGQIIEPITLKSETAQSVTSTESQIPEQPNVILSEDKELIWYEYNGYSAWCIKYNNCMYVNEIEAEHYLNCKFELRTTGFFRDNTYKRATYVVLNNKEVEYNKKDSYQCTIEPSPFGTCINLTWLIENLIN
jgi:hypothetical protein